MLSRFPWVATLLAVAGLSLAAARPAFAQSTEILRAQTGRWLVAAQDGKPGCVLTLEMATTIGGRAVTVAPGCEGRMPSIADAAAWDLSDGLILRDPTRKVVARFSEDETAIWRDAERDFVMVKARAGVDRLPHAPAIFGAWTMRRPDGPVLCEVSFFDRPPPGGQESFALTLRPGCDAAVTRLKLASWRIEAPYLMLYGTDGESLGFELTANGFTKRPQAGGRPLLLQKKR